MSAGRELPSLFVNSLRAVQEAIDALVSHWSGDLPDGPLDGTGLTLEATLLAANGAINKLLDPGPGKKHCCRWGEITWGEASAPEPDGDTWMVEQRGTCSCGKAVIERFYSDDNLLDAETGDPIE